MVCPRTYAAVTCETTAVQPLQNRLRGSDHAAQLNTLPSLTDPSSARRTLAALMSRWILPSECRYDNPISNSRHTMAISLSVNTPGFNFHVSDCFCEQPTRSRQLPPARYSITIHRRYPFTKLP